MKLQISVILVGFLALPSLILGSPELKSDDVQGKFFLKSYQTTTITTLSIVVTTVPYFCALTAGTDACQGRRLRRKKRLSIPDFENSQTIDLEKSTGDMDERDLASIRDAERLFFTLWQSTTTTVTITSTATNTSITISASAYCTFANYNVPLC